MSDREPTTVAAGDEPHKDGPATQPVSGRATPEQVALLDLGARALGTTRGRLLVEGGVEKALRALNAKPAPAKVA